MKAINLSTEWRIYIFSSLFLVIAAVGIVFFLVPEVGAISRLNAEFAGKKDEIDKLLEAGSNPMLLEKLLDVHNKKTVQLNKSLLVRGEEIKFIQFLESQGKLYSIDQTIYLSEKGAVADSSLPVSMLTLNITGTFHNFLRYLASLERSPYYINIISLTLESSEKSARRSPVSSLASSIKESRATSTPLNSIDYSKEDKKAPSITIVINAAVRWLPE